MQHAQRVAGKTDAPPYPRLQEHQEAQGIGMGGHSDL